MSVGKGNLEDCGLLGQSFTYHLRSTASMIPPTARVAQVQADINLVDKRGQSPLWLGSHMSRDLNYRKVIICGAFTADVFSWFWLDNDRGRPNLEKTHLNNNIKPASYTTSSMYGSITKGESCTFAGLCDLPTQYGNLRNL